MYNISFLDNDATDLIPVPDWSAALITWGICWDIHVYGFSVFYTILAVLTSATYVRFRIRVHRHKIVYNTLLLLATSGIFRAVYMLVDPYGYKARVPSIMMAIISQAVYPLFCASYGLTQVMLVRLTHVDVGHNRCRTLSCLLGCTLTYLFVVVLVETLVYYESSVKLLLILDSGGFIIWSLALSITFICSGFRLSQYATETKKARKQLQEFCSKRRPTSCSPELSSFMASDNLSPTTPDTLTISETISPTSEEFHLDPTTMSPTFLTSGSWFPHASGHAAPIRLSRPRLKISDKNHMTVTIATDEDDQSTSSTEVDISENDRASKRTKRVKKHSKQKQKHLAITKKLKSASSASYHQVSVEDKDCISKKFHLRSGKKSANNETSSESDDSSINRCALSSAETKLTKAHDSFSLMNVQQPPNKAWVTSPQSQLSASSLLPHQQFRDSSESALKDFSPAKTVEGKVKNQIFPEVSCNRIVSNGAIEGCASITAHLVSGKQVLSREEHTDLSERVQQKEDLITVTSNGARSNDLSNENNLTRENSFKEDSSLFMDVSLGGQDSLVSGTQLEHDYSFDCCQRENSYLVDTFQRENNLYLNSCPQENGYLADAENIFICSKLSNFSSTLHRTQKSGESRFGGYSRESSSSETENDSATKQSLIDRLPCSMSAYNRLPPSMSASLGLFRIRQSKVVQRAVHLTYFLTLLFIFASLLQVYTVFGVYGVLGPAHHPEPWPWLVFQTIFRFLEECPRFQLDRSPNLLTDYCSMKIAFSKSWCHSACSNRATEVAIGFTTAAVAYITLNYHYHRVRRRRLQQKHLVVTRDCVV